MDTCTGDSVYGEGFQMTDQAVILTLKKILEVIEEDVTLETEPEALQVAIERMRQPEIIRCKNCKHRETVIIDVFPEMEVPVCDHMKCPMGDDDYCSKADRKEYG